MPDKRIRIVIAHGRAATWDVPGTSKPSWTEALRFGIQRTNVPRSKVDALDVGYAAFGQLWRPDPIMPPADPSFGAEARPTAFQLPPLSKIAHWFGQAGVLAPITGSALTRMLADVFEYLGDGPYFAGCNELVAQACTDAPTVDEAPTDVILVGFSLGAIVSYCTVMQRPKLPVRALITCGNPIAFGPIYPALEHRMKGATPFPVGRTWTDLWCRTDAASAVHGTELAAKFPGGTIRPLKAKTRPPGAFSWFASHAPFDYLSSTVMGQAVKDAIKAIDPAQALD